MTKEGEPPSQMETKEQPEKGKTSALQTVEGADSDRFGRSSVRVTEMSGPDRSEEEKQERLRRLNREIQRGIEVAEGIELIGGKKPKSPGPTVEEVGSPR